MINLVLRLLRNEYPEYGGPAVAGGVSLHALEGGVAAAALVGSIIGQLVAGEFFRRHYYNFLLVSIVAISLRVDAYLRPVDF